MAGMAEIGGGAVDGGDVDGADWDGSVPSEDDDDQCVRPWNVALHGIISSVFGDGRETGFEPWWGMCNDEEFCAAEEVRRGLRHDALQPFCWVPYFQPLTTCEYTTCRNAQVEATLFGTGEVMGEWVAYTLFYAKPAQGKLRSFETGQCVCVGTYPFEDHAVFTRILRGTKRSGTAANTKTQHCYYALLKVGENFKYAAMKHVRDEYDGRSRPNISIAWCDDETAFEGLPPDSSKQLADFTPKSVSAVAKSAALYIRALANRVKSEPPVKKCKGKGAAVSHTCWSDVSDASVGSEDDEDDE